MRRFVRPTTDLFHEGDTLDAYQLNRAGAFNGPTVLRFGMDCFCAGPSGREIATWRMLATAGTVAAISARCSHRCQIARRVASSNVRTL